MLAGGWVGAGNTAPQRKSLRSRAPRSGRGQRRRHHPAACKGVAMSRDLVAHNKPVFDQLHPRIYYVAAGLLAWFALMAWALFGRSAETSLALIFVSVLFLVAVLVPWVMSLVWKKYQLPYEQHPQPTSFKDWRDGDFAVWGAKLHGSHAAIDALLPLIAVSFGLMAIGIVYVIVRASVGA